MRKYGTPEPVQRVPEEHESDADPQGINVTATRREAESYGDIPVAEILDEGEENGR